MSEVAPTTATSTPRHRLAYAPIRDGRAVWDEALVVLAVEALVFVPAKPAETADV